MTATVEELLRDIIWPESARSFVTVGIHKETGRFAVYDNDRMGVVGYGETFEDALRAFQIAFFQAVEEPPGICGFHTGLNWTEAVLAAKEEKIPWEFDQQSA